MRTLIIDNYDSFTFNLYQALARVNGSEPLVVRNDQLTADVVAELEVANIVISPGPGRPEHDRDFGVCMEILRRTEIPVLGVCLGCQGLGVAYGAEVIAAPEPMHGRLSPIQHDDASLFVGLPQGFLGVRYHSLIVASALPPDLRRIAWTRDGLLMGLRHTVKPLWGIQFHPESISTEHGLRLLENFRRATEVHGATAKASRRSRVSLSQPVSVVPRQLAHAGKSRAWKLHWRRLAGVPSAETAFVRLYAENSHAFWLDSSLSQPELARFSFLGAAVEGDPVWTFDVESGRLTVAGGKEAGARTADLFESLRHALAEHRCGAKALPFDFQGGFVGYLGYEMKAALGMPGRHRSPHPDAAFMLIRRFLAFDHADGTAYLVCVEPAGEASAGQAWMDLIERRLTRQTADAPIPAGAGAVRTRWARPESGYLEDVRACQRHILAGESYEVCLTNNLHVEAAVNPLQVHRRLRQCNPAPHAAFLRLGDLAIVSSSPERFIRVDRKGQVETRPIKGTLHRGASAVEDLALREALRHSVKDRAEHLMIVDLMRNDLGLVCEIGSVAVPKLMAIESYATVHQMVSTVHGQLRRDLDAVDCVRQAFPAGSMTGAPKRRTLEILDGLESEARGVYSGAIGYFGFNGTADFSVVIRTAVITPGDISIGTGGAVVALSDADDELAELQLKVRAVLDAVSAVARGASREGQAQIYE